MKNRAQVLRESRDRWRAGRYRPLAGNFATKVSDFRSRVNSNRCVTLADGPQCRFIALIKTRRTRWTAQDPSCRSTLCRSAPSCNTRTHRWRDANRKSPRCEDESRVPSDNPADVAQSLCRVRKVMFRLLRESFLSSKSSAKILQISLLTCTQVRRRPCNVPRRPRIPCNSATRG